MRMGKNERKILITSVSWVRSAKENTYIHIPLQKVNYKKGEVVKAAFALSFGVSENIGYVIIKKIDQKGHLHLKLVQESGALSERVGRKWITQTGQQKT